MGQVIVLKHVRLSKALVTIETAARSLSDQLHDLHAVTAAGLPEYPNETILLLSYVRTLSILLQTMTPDEIDEAGLVDRHALAEAAVDRCAASLRALTAPPRPATFGDTA